MRRTTHATVGISCSLFISEWFMLNPFYAVAIGIFYSLLADIDTGYSTINKYLIRIKWLRNKFMPIYYLLISIILYIGYYTLQYKVLLVLSFLSLLLVIGKHRTFYHSLFMLVPQGIILHLMGLNIHLQALALMIYSSHLFLDMFNPSGVKLFYPLSDKSYRFPITINSRSKWSTVIEWLLTLIVIYITVKYLYLEPLSM